MLIRGSIGFLKKTVFRFLGEYQVPVQYALKNAVDFLDVKYFNQTKNFIKNRRVP
jgi:hypothetical protein